MKTLFYFSILLVGYFIYGFYINQFDLSVVQKEIKKNNPSGYFDYRGAINISSQFSNGSAEPEFISESAKVAGLDFLFFTDLNNFSLINSMTENYNNNFLSLWGHKVSYLDSRILYYNLYSTVIEKNLGSAQLKLSDLLTQKVETNTDSLLILAHPLDRGYSWKGELPIGLDGIELINIKSISDLAWSESPLSVLWSIIIYPFNSRLALIRLFTEPQKITALYDQKTQKRKLVAVMGSEASAKAIPFTGYFLKFPTYVRNFELASNHVLLTSELTGNFKNDKKKIFTALKNGNSYLAFDILGDPRGFIATMENKKNKYLMGSSVPLTKDLQLNVSLPNIQNDFFEIIIFHNGEKLKISNDKQLSIPINKKGTYRVQVRISPIWPLPDAIRWVSWIYSNPFYVD